MCRSTSQVFDVDGFDLSHDIIVEILEILKYLRKHTTKVLSAILKGNHWLPYALWLRLIILSFQKGVFVL